MSSNFQVAAENGLEQEAAMLNAPVGTSSYVYLA